MLTARNAPCILLHMMDEQYKKDFIHAGKIAKEVRAYGKGLIRSGASYNGVVAQINQKIKELGAIAAFPPQMALNDTAAHYLPSPGKEIIFSNEIVKLDVGVCFNGAIGDCAVTIDLSGKHQPLIDAAEAALLAAEQILKVGLPIREIGQTIEKTILARGFQPIRNLSGHGLGLNKVHTPPTIPNYDDKSKGLLKAGMTFAIEPFATTGKGLIYEEGLPAIFSFLSMRPLPSDNARRLLTKIITFNGLPFATHDLLETGLSLPEIEEGLKQMMRSGVIAGYGPLIEEARGMVAQAENSVLIDDEGSVFVTTR
jgi:methionyl aminopeptidase